VALAVGIAVGWVAHAHYSSNGNAHSFIVQLQPVGTANLPGTSIDIGYVADNDGSTSWAPTCTLYRNGRNVKNEMLGAVRAGGSTTNYFELKTPQSVTQAISSNAPIPSAASLGYAVKCD
jgi:hypothetical protein